MPPVLGIVAYAQHDQRIAQARKAQTQTALGIGLLLLLRQRPLGCCKNVVEHAHRQSGCLAHGFVIEMRLLRERLGYIGGKVETTQTAAAIIGQRLLTTRIGGLDVLAVGQIVLGIDAIQKQNARLGCRVSALHDAVPDIAGTHTAVDPQPVRALMCTLSPEIVARLGRMHQLELRVVVHGLHECIGHTHRHIEIIQLTTLLLGGNEIKNIGMRNIEHRHLRTTTRSR